MRAEKKYLVDEIGSHLDKSDYVFLADYNYITVAETAELRTTLAEHDAEFHVIKNSMFRLAAKEREFPSLDDHLTGPTAIVVGGDNPPGVAKALGAFIKEKKKVELKGGLLAKKLLEAQDIGELAKLPPLPVVQSQFLSLLNTPARQTATIVQAVPQGILNVIKSRSDQLAESEAA